MVIQRKNLKDVNLGNVQQIYCILCKTGLFIRLDMFKVNSETYGSEAGREENGGVVVVMCVCVVGGGGIKCNGNTGCLGINT